MDGIAWAGSAMEAAQSRLDIATGNLANVSTGGFEPLVARGALTKNGVSIVVERGERHGALRPTGRDLDLAIAGDGAFIVRDRNGKLWRTRDGAFVRNRDGSLSDPLGRTLVRTDVSRGSAVRHGFLETSGADAIAEMIDVLWAQRSFESAQKAVSAIDGARQRAADAARLK
ncbi:MAG TPA: flagellar basal body rod C-terminal domain-containing protein [Candidatus Baltobacteraceae bacterium]|jgi:flagellar basal body rod protein FlgG